jgi:YggT family protein
MTDRIQLAFLWLFDEVTYFYLILIIVAVVMSWLLAFDVINRRNPFALRAVRFLNALTEPLFRLVRRVIPPIGGFDFSPMIVALGVIFVRILVLGRG